MTLMYLFANNKVVPILTDASHLLCSFSITRTVVSALLKPYGQAFKVTAKGVSTDKVVVQWNILIPFLIIGIGTFLGMMYSMLDYSSLSGGAGYSVNVFWSLFNMMILTICCMVCVEFPKMRRFERFLSGENATLDIQGNKVNCIVRDISLGGAKILLEKKDLSIKEGQDIILNIYNVDIPAKVNRFINNENEIATKFSLDTTMRRFLIGRLFTGNYDNEIGRVSVWGAIKGITRKTFY
jgi:cellulose synthase (UDP-forming)